MKIVRPIIIGLIPLVLGTLLGFYLESQRSEKDQSIRYLYYDTYISVDIINKPNINTGNLDITFNGQTISNLSVVSIELYNTSDRDYQDIPIYIELVPANGQTINMISEDVSGAGELRETIAPIQNVLPSQETGSLRYGYTIKTVNRLGGFDPVFQARYIILGSQEPIINVEIDKPGVLLSKYDYSAIFPVSWWERYWYTLLYFTILTSLIGYVIIYYFVSVPKQFSKNIVKDRQLFEEAYSEAISKFGENANLRDFSLFLYNTKTRLVWENTSKINRWLFRWNKPTEYDSKTEKQK